MPHVIVKLWPGKSQAQKERLARLITENVTTVLGYGDDSVSVGLEEVAAGDWARDGYQPDIIDKAATLCKKPGYRM